MHTVPTPQYLLHATVKPFSLSSQVLKLRRYITSCEACVQMQTRLTALDLIGYAAGDERPRQFVHMPEQELDQELVSIKVSLNSSPPPPFPLPMPQCCMYCWAATYECASQQGACNVMQLMLL